MMTKQENERGITLIALIVTIVVLLILAGVSINAIFGQNGIIQKAQDAQSKMDKATENDLDAINGLNELIDSKINGEKGEDTTLKSYEEAGKDASNNGVLTENAKYTDSETTTIIIPKGFKVSDVVATGDTDGEQTVSKGLVIQDANGNEFVWVPVNYTATGTLDDDGLDSGFKNTFKRTNSTESDYSEPYVNGYGENGAEEKSDYIKMMKSVQKNKGFYIGRYEAGTTTPRTYSTTTTSEVVVQRDVYPYIYVGWGNEMNDITTDVTAENEARGKGAVYLSKHMYDNKNIGATSTLCYGVQWDATMNFVSSTNDISDSTSWGNYMNNAWSIDRQIVRFANSTNAQGGNWEMISSKPTKTNSEGILLTTGASDSFKAKNIFDLAGNVFEWTMEANSSSNRITRGGCYDGGYGSDFPASFRNNNGPTNNYIYFGFRPVLYL